MRSLCWVIFIISIILVVSVRLRLLGIPFERDEGEYAYMGQLMLHGVAPYKLAYNMKFPGTHMAYALLMAVFGESAEGVHLGFLIINLASTFLVFFLSKRLFGTIAALVSAASYTFLSLSQSTLGLHAHATHFVMFFSLISILLLLKSSATSKQKIIFWSGFFSGLAVLMKQHGIFFSFFGLFYLWWDHFQKKIDTWLQLSKKLMFYCAGTTLPFLGMCIILYSAGVFPKFWFWTFKYAAVYGSHMPFSSALHFFISQLKMVMRPFQGLWYGALLGTIFLFVNSKLKPHAFFMFTLLFFSFLALWPGLVFRPHYFVMVLPVISLLIGAGFQSMYTFKQGRGSENFFKIIAVALFLSVLGWSVFQQRNYFFYNTPTEILCDTYPWQPFKESVEIASHISKESSPTDTIAVLGSEPQIYFYAHRHSATGYLYMFPLVDPQPYSVTMQKELITEIEGGQPQFIVFVHNYSSWANGVPELIAQWAQGYLYKHYDLMGLADLMSAYDTKYYWGKAAYVTPHSSFIQIYKRKK